MQLNIYLKSKCKVLSYLLALAIVALLGTADAIAEQATQPMQGTVATAAEDRGPEDALNRGTPRGSALGFLAACAEPDFEKASQYLDLRNLPNEVAEMTGQELARQLNHVLSRAAWIDDYTVSDSPEGTKGDGLPDYRDQLVQIQTPDGEEFPILMQRVPRGDGALIWKVSNRSVALIPELYARYSYPPLIETVRTRFPEDAVFLGLEAFKWAILLVLAALGWPVLWLLGLMLSHLFSSRQSETYPFVRKFFRGPFVMIGLLLIVGAAIDQLGAGAFAQRVMDARTLVTLALVWGLWSLANLYCSYKQGRLEGAGRPGAAKLLRPMTALVKLLFWLNNVGVNITTVLAGLGVGGLAVALALQKPIEDMMGALTIFSQAPMRVGDLVRYGDVLGTVEDIGLRTTRVRTLNNTVVSIPNARIAHLEVENLSYRQKIRYWPTLRLRYDTSLQQVREVCDKTRDMLLSHEGVHDEPVRVRFTDFEKDAILVKVNCFLKTTDFPESLRIGEDLNYGIMRIVEAAGATFALPGASIRIEGDRSVPTS